MKTSYIEDKNLLAYCVDRRDYSEITLLIKENKSNFDYIVEDGEDIFAYKIKKIPQLTNIYNYDVFAINFSFNNIEHEFNDKQNKLMESLVKHLSNSMKNVKGYFIIKVPSDNLMLIDQLNIHTMCNIFAGGTVCYYTKELRPKKFQDDDLNIRQITMEEKVEFKDQLLALGRKSFENYFGQYHISYITRDKAPIIYENWVEGYINTDSEDILIATYGKDIAGFLTIDNQPHAIEMVLSAVNEKYRGAKVYERMIRAGVELSLNKNKLATLSTQFDNYLVQRAWVNIGFKPYYSFYLKHYNNL
jgi:ribosomal protein S18 acetylase RimI-like enzyme